MKFHDPNRYEILAGEYALGTLSGPARRRFERYMQYYPFLRRAVETWEARFNSVVEGLEPVEPPPRIWEQVCEDNPELRRRFEPKGLWSDLRIWKPLALFASALAVLLVVYLNFGPRVPELAPPSHVAMIQDPKSAEPAFLLTVVPGEKRIKVTAMKPPETAADKSLELWMLPGKDQAPVSLGLLPKSGTAELPLSEEKLKVLAGAAGLAVSLEPKGGSPTGAPTGPVLFQASLYSI